MIRITSQRVRGFTLIELLVTMAIFITVITIAVGALFSAQAVNVRLEQTQVILDEVNLVTELIIRDIRYGTTFYCDTVVPSSAPLTRKSCPYPTGGTVLIFRPVNTLAGSTNPLNDRVGYFISNGTLYKTEWSSDGSTRTSQLTSSNVSVSSLAFFTNGAQSTTGTNDVNNAYDLNQPVITIAISGVTVSPKKNTQPVYFSIQTSVSSREIDN